MPNQRKAGQWKVGAWVDRDTADTVLQEADARGLTVYHYVKLILKEHINQERRHGEG